MSSRSLQRFSVNDEQICRWIKGKIRHIICQCIGEKHLSLEPECLRMLWSRERVGVYLSGSSSVSSETNEASAGSVSAEWDLPEPAATGATAICDNQDTLPSAVLKTSSHRAEGGLPGSFDSSSRYGAGRSSDSNSLHLHHNHQQQHQWGACGCISVS